MHTDEDDIMVNSAVPLFDPLVEDDVPEAPLPPAMRPMPEQGRLSRATSDPNHQSSFSFLTRRHFSKLGAAVAAAPTAPIARDMDSDSIISEPCSYSSDAFVASDLWLVQRDVGRAEHIVAQRDRHDLSTDKSSSMYDLARRAKQGDSFDFEGGAVHRFDGDDLDSGDVAALRARGLDADSPSSVLVRQYFSGAVAGHGGRHMADRDKSSFRADGTTFQRTLPERSYKKFGLSFGKGSNDTCVSQSMGQMKMPGQSLEAAPVEEGSKRNVSRARRLRWWIRRVSHRFRLDSDPY